MTTDAKIRAAVEALVTALVDAARAPQPAPAAEYLTTTDAATVASVNEGTIRRWVRAGKLRGHCGGPARAHEGPRAALDVRVAGARGWRRSAADRADDARAEQDALGVRALRPRRLLAAALRRGRADPDRAAARREGTQPWHSP